MMRGWCTGLPLVRRPLPIVKGESLMASIATDKDGNRRVLFVDGTTRRAIHLGGVPLTVARTVHAHTEHILAAKLARVAVPTETAAWLGSIEDRLHAKLARVGLVEPRAAREAAKLGPMLDAWIGADATRKPSTITRMKQARALLAEHFGEHADPGSIGLAEAEGWQAAMRADYSPATIARTTVYVRSAWAWAKRRRMVDDNPFAELRAGAQTNPDRVAFVDRPTLARVLDAAPDHHWRLLVLLSRIGALRVPSEAMRLRWDDVDWAGGSLRVRSPKTEHHEGKGERRVPLFPELREALMVAFERAPAGAERVLPWPAGYNPHTQFLRIIARAGVKAWPRLWHSMRASRQTELAATFPLATACAWTGNTKAIAAGHYLQQTDADWQRALAEQPTQNPTQHTRAPTRNDAPEPARALAGTSENTEDARLCATAPNDLMGGPGLEPGTLRL